MFDYQPRLTGEKLHLRPVQIEDWAGLAHIGCDPDVWAGHPDRERYATQNFKAYFDDGLASGHALVALDKEADAIVGWSRYSSEFVEPGEIEIGWTFLGRAYWGGSWNAEMKLLMLRHAFQFVDRVVFRVGETNGRSRRAVEKLGATLMPQRVATVSHGVAQLYYGIDRETFAPRDLKFR